MSDLGRVAAPSITRVVLHVDMNAFFVSVELLRRPDLVGRPVVVGGTGRRGVVAAANYEARRYGVHSAMPSMRARQLCPDAVFLSGDYDRYSEVSAAVRTIFQRFTPKVEPLSLDEAFLDVTGALRLFGGGPAIAAAIRAAIDDELQLGCSVGVAPNKFLAKMASVAAKPRASAAGIDPGPGVVEIRPGEEQQFLDPLPVRRIGGIGRVTGERLAGLGVVTVADLRTLPTATLHAVFGRAGAQRLAELARGIDDRPVEADRAVKSISHEETYPRDLFDRAEIHTELHRLADGVASRLRRQQLGGRTIGLKLRDATFTTHTRARTVVSPLDSEAQIAAIAVELADRLLDDLEQRPGTAFPGVRLLGVVASKLNAPHHQLTLDGFGEAATGEPSQPQRPAAALDRARSQAIDQVRERFGATAIGAASALGNDGVRVVRPGQHQWGHDAPPGPGSPPPTDSRDGPR